MASVNKVILIGNLGSSPENRYMPNGTLVATVSLATTKKWKDKKSGLNKERTEWHRAVFFGRLAEIVVEHLDKGSQVCVEGELRTRKWTGSDGIDRYTTEVFAAELQMLGKKDVKNAPSAPVSEQPPVHDNFDDDLDEFGQE